MASGSVTVRLNLNSAGYSAEMTKAEAQMRRLARAGQEFGHSTVSTMQASSASIRVLQGGLDGNIRAAERFISLLPGVGAALQAAFPVVGAIALLGVFVRIGEEVGKFISKLNEIPENPFSGMIASAKLSNDALAITNDRLANEIAKLEHKPTNRMAEALDEMRQASDKLFDSLEKSNAAFDEATKKGGVGTLQGRWQNLTPTDQADADIKRARAGVQAVRDDHKSTIDDALASGDPENVKQAREALMVDLEKAYAVQDAALRAGLDKAQSAAANFHGSYSMGSDPRAVVGRYSSALQISAQDQQSVGGQYGGSLLSGQRDTAQDADDQTELAKEAARKQLQAMEDELEQRKAQYGMSIAAERSYWQSREAAFTAGSDAYRQVVNKVAALEIQMARQESESLKAARAEQASGSRDSLHVLEAASTAVSALMKREADDVFHTGERWKAYNDAVAKAGEIEAANAAAFDKARISIELESGQISKLDAAQQLAAVHAREFAHDLDILQQQRQQISNDSSLTPEQQTTELQQNSNATAVLRGRYQVQQAGDQSAIADQELGPASRKALDNMIQDWSDMTKGIVQTMTKAADSLNDDLVKAMTGQGKKSDFGHTFMQAGQGLLKTGLQGAEGNLLKALHIGGAAAATKKPTGAKGDPIHTVNDPSDASKPGIPGLPPFVQPFIGGQSSQGDDSGGDGNPAPQGGFMGFLGKMAGLLLRGVIQGGFAGGGNFVANRPMLVGEHGAEIITPDRAGSVIPNRMLGGGGGDTHVYNIDARGSNDPMAVHAAVARALPHAVAASIQANHQSRMRSPGGR